MEPLLQAILYRNTCPSAARLLDYHLGRLMGSEAEALANHLIRCRFCTQEVHALSVTDLEAVVAPTQVDRWQQLLTRLRELVPTGPLLPALGQLTPATAALRSGAPSEELHIYQAEEYRISLASNKSQADASSGIEGSVIHQGDPSQVLAAVVYLLQGETVVAQGALDEFGLFTFPDCTPGSYTLLLQFPTHSIWIQEFNV